MVSVRVCLLCDGASDQALRWPLQALIESRGGLVQSFIWADFRFLPDPPRSLAARMDRARRDYPADILFIHRDAEREPTAVRVAEIEAAARESSLPTTTFVPVVPVRATEAWLLHDEAAIRAAAGNPNGRGELGLPRVEDVERLADPKDRLQRALIAALPDRPREKERARRRFGEMRMLVAERSSYDSLAKVIAFAELGDRVSGALAAIGPRA